MDLGVRMDVLGDGNVRAGRVEVAGIVRSGAVWRGVLAEDGWQGAVRAARDEARREEKRSD